MDCPIQSLDSSWLTVIQKFDSCYPALSMGFRSFMGFVISLWRFLENVGQWLIVLRVTVDFVLEVLSIEDEATTRWLLEREG